MAGVIDDLQDSLNEILRAANLPVSVMVIKIGPVNEDNDSTILMKKAMQTFTKCERNFIEVLTYENYKNPSGNLTTILQ
jgi:hypothetical protein